MAYKVTDTHISHDTQGNETVVIDFSGGTYYSLVGTASTMWVLAASGATDAVIVETLTSRYDGDAAVIADQTTSFLADLIARGLLVASDSTFDAAVTARVTRTSWSEPKLEAFNDLNDLILMDPIHDVDDAGWPHPKGDVD